MNIQVLDGTIKVDYLIENLNKGKIIAKNIALKKQGDTRVHFAQSFCNELICKYWTSTLQKRHCNWKIVPSPPVQQKLDKTFLKLAHKMGDALASLPVMEVGYFIGSIYTTLLPDDIRSRLGAYYTPPTLVDRLLDIVTDSGFNWKSGRVLDPACGGAAFLAPVALRMKEFHFEDGSDPTLTLHHITTHLHGFEIDPFAAWISQVILEISLLDVCLQTEQRLPSLITVGDSLILPVNKEPFDLVIGNPPYGRITLTQELRKKYERSLYGHANLYGVFTDLAIRWVKKKGFIAYVTPTSFLGGQYFKKLRNLLGEKAPPLVIDFISDRTGVFEDVLQETALVVFKSNTKKTQINTLTPNGNHQPFKVSKIGSFKLPSQNDEPWLFPRSLNQKASLGEALTMTHRLSDYGFSVSTGPLVWNRHKDQLKTKQGPNRLPLIWAESVLSNGTFRFNTSRKNHKPFFQTNESQEHLIMRKPCVLLQRTTATEQNRRLIAAVLAEKFFLAHKEGVVIENHLNVIKPVDNKNFLSLEAMTTLLNSQVIDQVFRCISGSVAVSAYELNALPLPEPNEISGLEHLVKNKRGKDVIDNYIAKIYGVTNEN